MPVYACAEGQHAWSYTGRDCRYQSFIASAPSGRSSRNQECSFISSMHMRSFGLATNSRDSRSRQGADTCHDPARVSQQAASVNRPRGLMQIHAAACGLA